MACTFENVLLSDVPIGRRFHLAHACDLGHRGESLVAYEWDRVHAYMKIRRPDGTPVKTSSNSRLSDDLLVHLEPQEEEDTR